MLSENLRVRIAQLNRSRPLERHAGAATRRTDLESLLPGEAVQGSVGSFYQIRRPIAEFGPGTRASLSLQHQQTLLDSHVADSELIALARAFPARTVFLDLETCGFSGAPLFLIGLLRQVSGGLVVEQLLARDYAEEPAVLDRLWSILPNCDVLVTFNGKAFDWPFVLDRTTVHRLAVGASSAATNRPVATQRACARASSSIGLSCPSVHCDLLPLARRYWKQSLDLPNCKLQTLEAALCRRYRSGDIPGHMIPDAYHAFVRSGDARQIKQVLDHNALDLITLAQLSLILLRRLAGD